jgi:phenazine-1-carboxylate N-methyltransferase
MKVDLAATRQAIEIITGGWKAQALYTAVKWGVPDHIEAGRVTSADLAAATGSEEEGVRRVMRLLVAMGVFEGDHHHGYRNTRVSRTLLDNTDSLRAMCLLYGQEFYTAWGQAFEAFSTVSSGFELAYDQPLYSRLRQDADFSARFQAAMKAGNLFFDYVPDIFDFAGKRVVDVGGGNGQLLSVILAAHPDAKGVLLELEHVLPAARQNLAGCDRVELVGGSMFDGVPPGGDVYLFCRVLAGWEDDDAVKAFENVRRVSRDVHLLVLDRMVVTEESTVLPALWDLHLLMTTGGRHRSAEHFTHLLNQAGWDVERRVELPVETSVLIAAPTTSAYKAARV